MRSRKLLILSLAAGLCVVATQEAGAKGCNGVVSQGEWGCAAWDNNNGPQFPHYKKPGSAQPAAVVAPSALAQKPGPVLAPNKVNAPVNANGAGLVASGGGNLVSSGGGNFKK